MLYFINLKYKILSFNFFFSLLDIKDLSRHFSTADSLCKINHPKIYNGTYLKSVSRYFQIFTNIITIQQNIQIRSVNELIGETSSLKRQNISIFLNYVHKNFLYKFILFIFTDVMSFVYCIKMLILMVYSMPINKPFNLWIIIFTNFIAVLHIFLNCSVKTIILI